MIPTTQRMQRSIFFWKYKRFLKKEPIRPNKSIVLGGGSIVRVDLYDVLNNKDTHALIRKIRKLNKSDFKTKLFYRKSRFKSLNYIRPQFDHTSVGMFAEITPKNNDLIKHMSLSWTQINNDEAIMQYSFTLHKPVRTVNDCRKAVLRHWSELRRVKVLPFYRSTDVLTSDSKQNTQYVHSLFLSIFQGFVNKNLYTRLGNDYQLPVNVLHLAKDKKVIDKIIKDSFLYRLYRKGKSNVYIGHDVTEKWQIDTIIIGDSYSGGDLLTYFTDYTMDYYYFIFGDIEINELSKRLVGYFNKGKTKISYSNRKWLLKKFRRVSEVKLFPKSTKNSEIFGVTEDVKGEDYIHHGLANRFKDVYEDNLKYINSVFNLSDVHIWVWIILVISFLSLVVSGFGLANDLSTSPQTVLESKK